MATFLVLQTASQSGQMIQSDTTLEELQPSQKILNICSPFGLNAKELFLNVQYKGQVVNKLSSSLYLSDLDGHLVNVEGSPVFDKRQRRLIGIRLPSVHSFNLFMGCSLFVPLQALIEPLRESKP